MNPEAQAALLAAGEAVLVDATNEEQPIAGRRTLIAFSAAAEAMRSRVRQLDPETGEYLGGWTTSAETDARFQQLREAMATPGEGTWYWMVLEVGPAGELDARFAYDEPPEWEGLSLLVQPSAYRLDLERYPRSRDRLPGWLLALLGEPD